MNNLHVNNKPGPLQALQIEVKDLRALVAQQQSQIDFLAATLNKVLLEVEVYDDEPCN